MEASISFSVEDEDYDYRQDGFNISPPPPKKRSYSESPPPPPPRFPVHSRVWVELSNLPLYEGGNREMYMFCHGKATIIANNGDGTYRIKFDHPAIDAEVDLFDVDGDRLRSLNSAFPLIDTPQVRAELPVIVHETHDLWWNATIVSEAPDARNMITIAWEESYYENTDDKKSRKKRRKRGRKKKPQKETKTVPLCFVRVRA